LPDTLAVERLAKQDVQAGMNDTGRAGEELAARWLERHGMRVLHRNWRQGRNEIDLIVRDGQTIAFVEVKTRRLGIGATPAAAVSASKRRKLARVAAGWIATWPGEGREYRFDIVEVTNAAGGEPLIEHLPDAFRSDES
jgi:putative endonuclease